MSVIFTLYWLAVKVGLGSPRATQQSSLHDSMSVIFTLYWLAADRLSWTVAQLSVTNYERAGVKNYHSSYKYVENVGKQHNRKCI